MPTKIAIAGKGGTGKTTFAALLIRVLAERERGTVLAIDADPNSNLHEALGLRVTHTIADIFKELKSAGLPPAGMPKHMLAEYRLRSIVAESDRLDLLVMGTPEGRDATATRTISCGPTWSAWRGITTTSWLTMKPGWNISPGGWARTWT